MEPERQTNDSEVELVPVATGLRVTKRQLRSSCKTNIICKQADLPGECSLHARVLLPCLCTGSILSVTHHS